MTVAQTYSPPAPFIFATHWIKKVTPVADIFDPLFDPPFLKRL
jgi:hypothetical protein